MSFTWIAVIICVSQSALFSGLNIACFAAGRMDLQIEAAKKNKAALKLLKLRNDSNFLLATILWGNVAINVILAILANSLMAGVYAFIFSTVIITIFGEIMPQAYFSRNALRMASIFSPVIRLYQFFLFPVAKPTALILDRVLGKEGVIFYKERDIRDIIKLHMDEAGTEIRKIEGQGALNFLAIDDLQVTHEGEVLHEESIIELPFENDRAVFPKITADIKDPFLAQLNKSDRRWVVIIDNEGKPRRVINSDNFIRDALFKGETFNPYWHSYRPVITYDSKASLGAVLPGLTVNPAHRQDDVVDNDVILVWADEKRIITGSDVLGRLLRGIVRNPAIKPAKENMMIPEEGKQ